MSHEHKIETVNKYIEAVSTDNIDLIKEIYADNATVEDPVDTPPHEGIDAIVAFYGRIKGIGVKLTLTGPVRCTNNHAAFPFTANIGGKVMNIIDTFEFNDDGKVISMKAFWTA